MSRAPFRLLPALLVAALPLLAGCGPAVGRLSGKVTRAGQPATAVQMTFRSLADDNVQCRGVGLPDGVYQVDYGIWSGLPVGPCQVTVVDHTQADGSPLPAGEAGAAMMQNGQARRHEAAFEIEIAAGDSVRDFEVAEGQAGGS